MNGHFSVAIDGPSGAGKSTLARRLAGEFGFIYADTGAIYRTVGLAALRAGVDRRDWDRISVLLPTLDIRMSYDEAGVQRMYLNGEDVSREIRLPEISACASDVSALPGVRAYLMEMQRKLARENNVVMDGRDIGTVVLPEAELKIFLTASPEIRAQRRLLELRGKGVETDYDSVLQGIIYRDTQDSGRATAPLKQAEDAVAVDTSFLNLEESFALLCELMITRLTGAAGAE